MKINTRDNIAISATLAGNCIVIGNQVKPLDVSDLLTVLEMATKATDKDGSVSIGAELLQQMAKELILSKSSAGAAVTGQYGAIGSYIAFHGVRSDHREMRSFTPPEYIFHTDPNMNCGAG